jgi:hypothetical protein
MLTFWRTTVVNLCFFFNFKISLQETITKAFTDTNHIKNNIVTAGKAINEVNGLMYFTHNVLYL